MADNYVVREAERYGGREPSKYGISHSSKDSSSKDDSLAYNTRSRRAMEIEERWPGVWCHKLHQFQIQVSWKIFFSISKGRK